MSKDSKLEYELLREKKLTDVLEIMSRVMAREPSPYNETAGDEKN